MIERVRDRQNTPEYQTGTHWLIPTAGALRMASAVLDIVIICIGFVMLVEDQSGAAFLVYGSTLTALMGFPALVVLTRALAPYEPQWAMRALAAGGSIFLIHLGVGALILSEAFAPVMEIPPVNALLTTLAVLIALWVIWLIWAARGHDILRGALPWFGLAANTFSIIYVVLRAFRDLFTLTEFAETLLVLFLLLVYVVGTLVGVIWNFWLGIALIRGRITVSTSTPR